VRRIVQLSDLHFGRIPEGTCAALRRAVESLRPDLTIVSGDLTQRARADQFQPAARFLSQLPQPLLCVPGNHDVPLYDLFTRLVRPLARYRRWIGQEVDAFFDDGTVAVAALNTAHGWTSMHGRLGTRQCEALARHFGATRAALRVVVTHHPLDLPHGDEHPVPALAQAHLGTWIDELGADLFLAGHLHRSRTLLGPLRTPARRRAVFAQAGTASSDRHSGYGNAFNFVRAGADTLEVEHWHAHAPGEAFALRETARFARGPNGWQNA